MSLRAGSLRDQITIQRPETVQDDIGQPGPGWVNVAVDIWSNIRFQSGLEAIRADSPTSMAKVSIQIRKRVGIAADMRAVGKDGTVYTIRAVLPDMQRRDRINLTCEVVQ